jgi:molybdate transport system substrate-binding protein
MRIDAGARWAKNLAMTAPITGISSMATRGVLAELATAWTRRSGHAVAIRSVGGLEAAQRVLGGEAFDVVLLASDAIDKLIASGHLLAGSRVDLVRSPVAVSVRAGAARPDIASEDALKQAVLAAPGIGYSTGPSGTHLTRLFERWGIASEIQGRIVQAPPGVPVATLVARGEVELGFQQLSELLNVDGIHILGTLPAGAGFVTTFSAGLPPASTQAEAVREMLAFMNSADAAKTKRRHGMEPA